jgi:hypothetical protein
MANRYKWILLASDWYGMSIYDIPTVVRVLLSAPEEFAKIPHTSVQGIESVSKCFPFLVSKIFFLLSFISRKSVSNVLK